MRMRSLEKNVPIVQNYKKINVKKSTQMKKGFEKGVESDQIFILKAP